ncbi:MAG: hypothetical protein HC905_22125 [Bacteroidales bacterium]|nr:hypothetical protein [Bacteroidales bacterium]
MQNYNQAPLDGNLKEQAITQFRQLRQSLPTPPPFSPSERKIVQSMNELRKPFVEKALSYGEKVPAILPSFIKIDELKMDLATYLDYADLMKEYELLGKKLRDLMFSAGADCFYASLGIYNSAKMAMRVGMSEAKPIVDDLKILFEKEAPEEVDEEPVTNTAK